MEPGQFATLLNVGKKFGPIFKIDSYSSSIVWIFVLSILSILLSIIAISKKRRKIINQKPIPGPKFNRLFNLFSSLKFILRMKSKNINLILFQVICGGSYNYRKDGMWGFEIGNKSILILHKAETVEAILHSNEVLLKGFEYKLVSKWLKGGLLTSHGSKWHYRRKLLTPAFHFHILNEYIPVFNEQAIILSQKILKTMSLNDTVDISSLASLCTLDIICETAMGTKINAQENISSPYVQALHANCKAVPKRLLQPWLWIDFIYYRTKDGKAFLKNLQIMDQFTRKVIRERKEQKMLQMQSNMEETDAKHSANEQESDIGRKDKKRLALLDLLLDVHFKDPNFTLEDIGEEVDNFMFAGHDTTSSGLSWALYLLGLHPDIQQKAYEEIENVFGDDIERSITVDDIKELKYLECVIKETRRLYPPTPFIARDLENDTEINGCMIPKGTNCGILIYMLHRDPDVFPNPEVFDPERFTPANSMGRHPYAYIPFSAGPRNCIGQRFASLETIILLATVLRRFKLKSTLPLDKLYIMDDIVIRSENGLQIIFTPRKSFINCQS